MLRQTLTLPPIPVNLWQNGVANWQIDEWIIRNDTEKQD
jgi:hypothetical protein